MKGFQWLTSRWFMVLLIGVVVGIGLYAEQMLRDRIQPAPMQVPPPEQSSVTPPVRADGPLHEVHQQIRTEMVVTQPRWVF